MATGGFTELFEAIGRHQFIKLISAGLLPDSKVLEVGCGCLRGGYWLINFLRPGCYFGIEPNEAMLEAGKDRIVGDPVMREKLPRFSARPDFDLTCFNEVFDFVVARSVWSHASLSQIRAMLEGFSNVGHRGTVFLTSYVPAMAPEDEYLGTEFSWPTIRYQPNTLIHAAEEYGFAVDEEEEVAQQRWLRITHP